MLVGPPLKLAANSSNCWQRRDWIALLAILALSLLCFLPGLGAYGMLDPTDSFFFEVPREMIELNHFATPIYNYVDWLDKPAFPFWLIIVSYKILGMSDFSARLPAALSGIILVLATYTFSLKTIGRRAAILSAVVLSSSPLFLIVGHVALSDEALSMLFGMAMLFIGAALASDKQKVDWKAYIFLALAVLCKGPIALVLASGIIGLYIFTVSNSVKVAWENLLRLKPLLAAFLVFGFCLPYYYLAHVTTAGAFTEQFFFRQNLGRLQGKVNHLEPVWFYLPVFLAGYFPWNFYLFIGVPWLKKILSHRFELGQRQKFIVFCLCWFILVGVLFTLIPTRLPTYIVPFSPAFAILVGSYLDAFLKRKEIQKSASAVQSNVWEDIFIAIPPILAAILGSIALVILIVKMFETPFFVLLAFGLIIVSAAGFLSCQALWVKQYKRAFVALCSSSLVGCAVLVPALFCFFYVSHQLVINRVISIVKDKDANLATLFSPVPSIVFYLRQQVTNIDSLEQLAEFCKQGEKHHLLLASRNCLKMPNLQAERHIVYSDGKWYLIDVEGFPWGKNAVP